jgi:methyl-accepting chemotaxis protein
MPSTRRRWVERLLADVPVGLKVLIALAAVALVAVAVAAEGLVSGRAGAAVAEQLGTDNLVDIEILNHSQRAEGEALVELTLATSIGQSTGSAAQAADWLKAFEQSAAQATDLRHQFLARNPDADQNLRERWATQSDQFDARIRADVLPRIGAGHFADAAGTLAGTLADQHTLVDLTDQLIGTEQQAATTATNAARDGFRSDLITTLLVLGLGLAASAVIARQVITAIVGPMGRVSGVLRAVAGGDLTRRAVLGGRDELGSMADSLDEATESMRGTVEIIARCATALGSAAKNASSVAGELSTSVTETSERAALVAQAAEQVSHNVSQVAEGSKGMDSSIREIAENANGAAVVVGHAVQVAESTNRTVSKLGESSTEIGNVIKVITSIAEQTNLLALNATIEAARAGAAGKGFAVVAGEVKELAMETARATEDISRKVETIQRDTVSAVDAIGEIGDIIDRVNAFQHTIAAAVEEQSATTNDINRGVDEAAGRAAEIASTISGVAAASQSITRSVGETSRSAEELASLSEELQANIGRFTISTAADVARGSAHVAAVRRRRRALV